jgi:hypothetical protein
MLSQRIGSEERFSTKGTGSMPNNDAPLQPILIDERQAAEMLGVSARSLFSIRQKGEIPFVRLSCRVLYSPSALAKWIESRQSIKQGPNPSL